MRDVLKIFLLFSSLFIQNIYGDIDAQIRAIQNAPPSERFKLMNAFKKNIIKMKEQERIEAMSKLTKKSNNPQAKKVLKTLKEHAKRKEIQLQMETHHLGEDGILSSLDDQEGNYDE